MTKTKLRANLTGSRTVARLQQAMPEPLKGGQIVVDPNVIALRPPSILPDEKLILLLGIILHQMTKGVATVPLNGALALHVGLAGHDVDLHRRFGLECSWASKA